MSTTTTEPNTDNRTKQDQPKDTKAKEAKSKPPSVLSLPWAAVAVAGLVALGVFAPAGLVFLFALLVLVVVHEGGHFLVARRCKMRPTEFFVGFGPEVWARTTKSGVRYGLKAILAGGYVKIPGMSHSQEVPAELEQFTYRAASRLARLATIFAGPAANFVLAVVCFGAFIVLNPEYQNVSFIQMLLSSILVTLETVRLTFVALGQFVTSVVGYVAALITGNIPEARFLSVVGATQVTEQVTKDHWSSFFMLAGLFSVSLGAFNLLPLPPLDGGHMAATSYEWVMSKIRRRPSYTFDIEKLNPVAITVIVFFILLGLSALYLDIIHPVSLPS